MIKPIAPPPENSPVEAKAPAGWHSIGDIAKRVLARSVEGKTDE